MTHQLATPRVDSIAIVGMAGRFPGANTVSQYWKNLRDGVESLRPYTDEELEGHSDEQAPPQANAHFVQAGAAVEGAELFDAQFFGIYPKEAELMDPQHRLFLESSWHALEDAGYDPNRYPRAIGVFAGCYWDTYLLNSLKNNPHFLADLDPLQMEIANDKDYIATRVSFKLNLRGPAITLQTACSTSLVAIAQACQSLHQRQCDMALAGGVTLRLPQKQGYWHQEGSIFSPDGHCRAFDAQAKGTVFTNGLGVLALKRLDAAVADGDSIYAVIKGWALNNDGARKNSYTAPSVEGQAAVIRMAHETAGVDAETITYVEAHGTATLLGDPIEINGLTSAFRTHTQAKQFCAIGSVKTNIGHLDIAAGVAALMKVALALKHQQIPPSLHYQEPNPHIDFANSPFYVNHQLSPWPSQGHPRRAGVSAFGIGGTNAHVILEEAPPVETRPTPFRGHHLVLVSAKSQPALDELATTLADATKQSPDLQLADIAYTTQVGRQAFNHRRFVVAANRADAAEQLEAQAIPPLVTHDRSQLESAPVFMFPGQGVQYIKMGETLYHTEPIFKEAVDRCATGLIPHLDFDLRSILFHSDRQQDKARDRLNQTEVTQPAIFTLEYALAQLWMAWGIMPSAMIGHSIGEYAAACLAGIFTLEDTLTLVATRGKLMQALPAGSMMAVWLSEPDLLPWMGDDLSIAAINRSDLSVVAGPKPSIQALQSKLDDLDITSRLLQTSHAFHSTMMDPILEPFAECVAQVSRHAPTIPIVSTVTGTWMTPEKAVDPTYWARHLRQTVRFADGLAELLQDPSRILLEVGPGQTLCGLARQHPGRDRNQVVLASLPHAQQQHSETEAMLQSLGRLWQHGATVDWEQFSAHETRQRVHLPGYPFQRKRFWIDPPPTPTSVATTLNGQVTSNGHRAVDAQPNATDQASPSHVTIVPPPQPGPPVAPDKVEQIIQQQLHVMAQQLQLWKQS